MLWLNQLHRNAIDKCNGSENEGAVGEVKIVPEDLRNQTFASFFLWRFSSAFAIIQEMTRL